MEEKSYDVIVIVSAGLRHQIDDKLRFEQLTNSNVIKQAPAKSYDDKFVINTAKTFNADIVSNDQFREFVAEKEYLDKHQIRFKIVQGRVILED